MEVNFNIEKVLGCDLCKNKIVVLNKEKFHNTANKNYSYITKAINDIGELSSKAQNLKSIITTFESFLLNKDHNIYVMAENNKIIGYIKIGYKKLFVYDTLNKINEINPLCLLDFYIYESCQRGGYGKQLFDEMLKDKNILPHMIAYDKPSKKLLNFLRKHYGLERYVNQNNNFVVYNEYFNKSNSDVNAKTTKDVINSNNFKKKLNKYDKRNNFNNNKENDKNIIYNKYDNYDIDDISNKLMSIKISNNVTKSSNYIHNNNVLNNNKNNLNNINYNANNNSIKDELTSFHIKSNKKFTTSSSSYGEFYNK